MVEGDVVEGGAEEGGAEEGGEEAAASGRLGIGKRAGDASLCEREACPKESNDARAEFTATPHLLPRLEI